MIDLTRQDRRERRFFPAPENKYGFVAYATESGNPIPAEQLKVLYERVLGPIHEEVTAELRARIRAEDRQNPQSS